MTDHDMPGAVALRIRELIESKGIEKDQVRKKIMEVTGISKQGLTKWYSGDTPIPRTKDIVAIAKHFRADLIWLQTGQTIEEYKKFMVNGAASSQVDFGEPKSQSSSQRENHVLDRLLEGIQRSGVTDISKSLMETAREVFATNYDYIVREWLKGEREPSFQEAAKLCEFYGIAQRYVSLGKGPVLALDYIRAASNEDNDHHTETLNLNKATLLGNG